MPEFERRGRFDVSAADAYAWFSSAGSPERLIPPWVNGRVVARDPVSDGSRLELELRWGPIATRVLASHRGIDPGRGFVREQLSGPLTRWTHEHGFVSEAEQSCIVEDSIDYELPGGVLVERAAQERAERWLRRLFEFRHGRVRRDLARHAQSRAAGPLRIAISGASGLIGTQLAAFLESGGHSVLRLVRRRAAPGEIFWDPLRGDIDARALEDLDAVMHLAGESVAAAPWNLARRRAILDSRIAGTELLATTLAGLKRPPTVFLQGSAIGFYGETGEREVDESAPAGSGFLADVCRSWEAASRPASQAGIRVVALRLGIVLSPRGGMLRRLVPTFLCGFGGRIGSGRQQMSWVSLDDVLGAFLHTLLEPGLAGPVNVVAPQPVSNGDFARSLGRVLRRPTALPLPAGLVEFALGDMGREMLLASQAVRASRLQTSGFAFQFPNLDSALRFELGRP
jgi:uncharacterized protein (TIGR01777 family)